MHISSLPGEYGIGTFGKSAYDFIDFLKDTDCKYWQVLPFGPTDSYNSPYASLSAFAGNINFIDPVILFENGLLTQTELNEQKYANPYSSAFEFLNYRKVKMLYKAYMRIDAETKAKVEEFSKENAYWLKDYAIYTVLKEQNNAKEWYEWNENDIRLHSEEAINKVYLNNSDKIEFIEFTQYEFYRQWKLIKEYANKNGIEIIGDLPMYVSLASSDVWANKEYFDLDERGKPNAVAGVPPDFFCVDGQRWGNPLYDWSEMKKDGYSWWMKRLALSFELFDIVRIDHFRAFSAYWAIPADSLTARKGQWLKGPGMDFFSKVINQFGADRIIAEDLGVMDEGVIQLIKDTGFPCMRVLQFGFSEGGDNIHLPHNYPNNCVAYTGTHDNNTSLGWLWEASADERKLALDYCCFTGGDWAIGGYSSASVRSMIKTLWMSPAAISIVPIQDLCGFGKDTKMNVPGVANGNWAFRISKEQFYQIDRPFLKNLNETYRRK